MTTRKPARSRNWWKSPHGPSRRSHEGSLRRAVVDSAVLGVSLTMNNNTLIDPLIKAAEAQHANAATAIQREVERLEGLIKRAREYEPEARIAEEFSRA